MTEMVTSGSMSGEGKRSDGLLGESDNERRRSHLAPPVLYATALLFDSTDRLLFCHCGSDRVDIKLWNSPASAASLLQLWPGSVAGGPSRSANSILQSCSRRQSLTKRGSIASVRRTKSGRSTSTGKRARATALEHPAHLDNDRGAVRFVREAQPPSIHSAHGRSCRRSLAMSRHAPRAYMFPAPTITTSEPVRLERQIRRLS
jgi:hypothetical protein